MEGKIQLSESSIKQLQILRDDVRYARENGYERRRGLKGHAKWLFRAVYKRTQHIPVLGRVEQSAIGVAQSYWTMQRVESLEARLAQAEKRIRELEASNG